MPKILHKITLLMLTSLAFPIHGAPILSYSNYIEGGCGGAGTSCSGIWLGDFPISNSTVTNAGSVFTAGESGQLAYLDLAVHIDDDRIGTDIVTWSLHRVIGDHVDLSHKLWEETYYAQLSNDLLPRTTFKVTAGPALEEGSQYWLIANTPLDDTQFWYWQSADASTYALGNKSTYLVDFGDGRVEQRLIRDSWSNAMAVFVNPIPIPSVIWLVSIALIGLTRCTKLKP